MIPEIEIREDAREWRLRAEVVEKDYVLGWLLAGIAQNPTTKSWVFKGGTCLKKCFFETYRFSEDLDFTIPAEKPWDVDIFKREFASISDWVYERSGIELPKDLISFEAYQNPRGRTSMAGKLSYRGPLQPRGALPRVGQAGPYSRRAARHRPRGETYRSHLFGCSPSPGNGPLLSRHPVAIATLEAS